MNFAGKRVTIIGLAREGTALARFLAERGAQVTASDLKGAEELEENIAALEGLPIRYALGGHPPEILDDADALFISPGVPLEAPIVAEARRRGIPISSETRLFVELCPAPIIGVTGSSGKTTTVSLVGEMLKAAGFRTWMGGNIGRPLIGHLEEIKPTDKVVMELSSFQLELFAPSNWGRYFRAFRGFSRDSWLGFGRWSLGFQGISPHIAAILNITPNHLDRHETMAAYSAAKANILRWQRENDICVLGADDEITGRWFRRGRADIGSEGEPVRTNFPLRATKFGFSLWEEMAAGAFLRDEELILRLPGRREAVICRRQDIRLRGTHNVANMLAACVLAGVAGAPPETMAEVATTFEGVEHRLEPVRLLNGVLWVNDSIATSPERAVAAIKSFDEPLVLLAGGRDKKLPWGEFARLVHQRVKHLVLFGEAAELIEKAVRDSELAPHELRITDHGVRITGYGLRVHRCADLEEAVAIAHRLAEPGDVVLLAPGGTSFDAYRDFAARGEHFRALVAAL